jgi:hypothetical protein
MKLVMSQILSNLELATTGNRHCPVRAPRRDFRALCVPNGYHNADLP